MSDIEGKTVKGVLWGYVAFGGDKILSLLTTMILTRVLLPSDFGTIAAAMLVISVFDAVRDLGIRDALTYAGERHEKTADTAFVLSVVLGAIQMGGAIAVAPFASVLSDDPRFVLMVQVISSVLLLNSLAVAYDGILLGRLEFRTCYEVDLKAAVLRTIVAISLIAMGMGVWALAAGMIVGATARAVGRWWILDWRPHPHVDFTEARMLLIYGFHVTAVSFIGSLLARVDQFAIITYLDETILAFYVIALKLPDVLLNNINVVMSRVTFPSFVNLKNNLDAMRRYLFTVTRCMVMVSAPLGCGLAVTSPTVVPLVFGNQWAPAVPIMQLMSLSFFVNTITWSIGDAFKGLGRPDLTTWLQLTEALITAPLLWFSALVWKNAVVVAAILLGCQVVILVFRLLVATRIMKFPVLHYWKMLKGTLAATAAMIGSVTAWQQLAEPFPVALVLAGSINLGAVVYLATLWLLERADLEQAWTFIAVNLRLRPDGETKAP